MYFDDPEAAVSCDVAQIPSLAVDRCDGHALTGMTFNHLAVGRTVFVIGSGEERLDLLNVRLLHAGKLTDLDHPEPLQLLRTGLVVHIGQRQRFGVVLGRDEVFHDGAFADALVAVQYGNAVELDAGDVDTRNSSRECLSGHGADVFGVIGFQIFDEKGFHALYTVPGRKTVEIVPHRVEVPVVGGLRERDVVISA